jgi:hypothetical protein
MPSFSSVVAVALTLVGLYGVLASPRMARRRGFTSKRFCLDGLLAALGGAVGAFFAFLVGILVVRAPRGLEAIVLVALAMLLGFAPPVGGLYLGERLSAPDGQHFRRRAAILSLLGSTGASALIAFLLLRLTDMRGHGSLFGQELGFFSAVLLVPLLWVSLLVGFYSLAFQPATSNSRRTGGGVARRPTRKADSRRLLIELSIFSVGFCVLVLLARGNSRVLPGQGQPEGDRRFVQSASPVNREFDLAKDRPQVVDDYDLELVLKSCGEENGGKYADVDINYAGRREYDGERSVAGDNRSKANPMLYVGLEKAELLQQAKVLYRTHRLCTGQTKATPKNGREIAELSGYRNFVCRSRFYEQCIVDGSFDEFYDERCDYGVVRLRENTERRALDFAIKLRAANSASAAVTVSYVGHGRYFPRSKDGAKN